MGRGWFCLSLLLALAACSRGVDDPSPFAESRTPPQLAARFFSPPGWGWGYLQLGDGPVQRYGVSAPAVSPRADILVLPDYGETAETWFETARDLNERGYTVWVLEAVGQGGSQRLGPARDLGHVETFNGDIAAVRGMIVGVIRPRRSLIVIGQGTGAVIAARAVEEGVKSDGLILSSPAFRPSPHPSGPTLRFLGLGLRRAPGAGGWTRRTAFSAGQTHDPWRGGVTVAWQLANPDLRMGGPSLDWVAAFDATAAATRGDLRIMATPTLVLEGARARGCLSIPTCQARRWPGAGVALELERDPIRSAWLDAIDTFARSHLPPSPGA